MPPSSLALSPQSPLIVLIETGASGLWLQVADWVIWAIFTVEYSVLLVFSSKRGLYIRRNLLSLAVVVLSFPLLPVALGLVRLARLVRFARLLRLASATLRGLSGLKAVIGRRGVVYVASTASVLVLAGGGALVLLEPSRGGFMDGVWWAIVTASTVCYGDIAPTTVWGRLIAVIVMLAGVGVISTLAASITAYFVGREEGTDLAEIKDRLARMEQQLDSLLGQQQRDLKTGADASARRAHVGDKS